MSNQSDAEDFVDLVDEAENTLDHLERLTSEIQNYGAAAENLNGAATQLGTLSQSMLEVAAGLKQAGITLREIGTEKILESQNNIRDRVEQLSEPIYDSTEQLRKISNLLKLTLATAAISVVLGTVTIVLNLINS